MRVGHPGGSQVQGTEAANSKQTGRASESKKNEKTATRASDDASTSRRDTKAEISARSKEFAQAKAIATETPDVRADKIAEIKRRIAEGKYRVNPDAVA